MRSNRTATDTFQLDVRQYVSFLEAWFIPERWSSAEPNCPHRTGMPTSAEIAYALLRFGRFRSDNWDQWRSKGFEAVDYAIENTVFQTRRMLRDRRNALGAVKARTDAAERKSSLERFMSRTDAKQS
jgi:hypothetical protein